ncbi:hypothetical protein ACJX0J_025771 [Zea mays]
MCASLMFCFFITTKIKCCVFIWLDMLCSITKDILLIITMAALVTLGTRDKQDCLSITHYEQHVKAHIREIIWAVIDNIIIKFGSILAVVIPLLVVMHTSSY